MTAIVEAKNLGKRYDIYARPEDRLWQFLWPGKRQWSRPFWALRQVDLSLSRGEMLGIVGRNGAGKSTLLQMMTGTLDPTEGEIIRRGRIAALLELGAGFNPEFTGRENVFLAASILGLDRRTTEARFDAIAAFADIGDVLDQPVKHYSSGMYARLAFAVAAHVDADLLIIDEILSVGDVSFTQKCLRFIEDFRRTGAVLFVTHDTSAVIRLCSSALWLDHGQKRAEGEPKSVCEAYLSTLYSQSGQASQVQRDTALAPLRLDLMAQGSSGAVLMDRVAHAYPSTFDATASGFGKGGARITNVRLTGSNPENPQILAIRDAVELTIEAEIDAPLAQPILGFYVKDRLGQIVFGENTHLTFPALPHPAAKGDRLVATFAFELPNLSDGDYAMTVAIADGTNEDHIQHHWIHDALLFQVVGNRQVTGQIALAPITIGLSIAGND